MRKRLTGALMTLALAATLGAGGAGTATAATPTVEGPRADACVAGYVCVHTFTATLLVREGEKRVFDPPVRAASIVNATKVTYCLGGSYNRGLAPGKTLQGPYVLNQLVPSPSGICLTA